MDALERTQVFRRCRAGSVGWRCAIRHVEGIGEGRFVVSESVVAGLEVALDDALDAYAIVGGGVDQRRS